MELSLKEKVVCSLGAACLPGSGSPWWVCMEEAGGVSEGPEHLARLTKRMYVVGTYIRVHTYCRHGGQEGGRY